MFGRNKKNADDRAAQTEPTAAASESAQVSETPQDSQPAREAQATHDPVGGSFGPYDGDKVDFRGFDFSDFAKGGLDLKSMMVPVPHEAEVQVEMGPQGPQMIHVVTPHGRVTPVAFAAPRNGDLWAESVPEIIAGMEKDGLTVEVQQGPWGDEIAAAAGEGAMRIIGASGDRWMLRMTLAGPAGSAEALAELGRDIVARTFVHRGTDPIPAGSPLPVEMPQAMAEELQKQMAERQDAANAAGAENPDAQQ